MKASASTVALLFIISLPARGQTAALYEVPIEDRIAEATAIFEGRVVSQDYFWNETGTLIYTASRVEIFRRFKGEALAEWIEVVTPGGVIGFVGQSVDPALRLRPGDTGLFFAEPLHAGISNAKADYTRLQPVASVQGFVRYDEVRGQASDVFNVYNDIQAELYSAIEARTGAAKIVRSYRTPNSAQHREAKAGVVPVITGLSPNPIVAGADAILTITGTGFETYDGGSNSVVFFPNSNDGGGTLIGALSSQVVSWTDTEIRVEVPTIAGTGNVTVRAASGQQAASATQLTVDYNLVNVPFGGDLWRSSLQNKDSGGYSFRMSTSAANGGVNFSTSPAVAPFQRALLSWQEATFLNMRNDGGTTTSSTVDPNSDPDIIMFDNDTNPLPSGVLGRAFSGFGSCDGQTWYVAGVDLQFRRDGTAGINWNYGPSGTTLCCFDFESVALHELGHAHQLGHIISPGDVMHWQLSNGSDVRSLDPTSDVAGGTDIVNFSADLNTCGGNNTGMVPLTSVGVEDEELSGDSHLSAPYPNPSADVAQITLSVSRAQVVTVDLYDLLGRRVRRLHEGAMSPFAEQQIAIDGKSLPAGVYFVAAVGEDFRETRRAVLLD